MQSVPALLLLCCSCAASSSTRPAQPLGAVATFPVAYSAYISREGFTPAEGSAVLEGRAESGWELREAQESSPGTPVEDARAGGGEQAHDSDPTGGVIDSRFQLLEVPSEALSTILPWLESGELGRVVTAGQVERLLKHLQTGLGESAVLCAPRLFTRSGEGGSVSILEQSAYIRSFKLSLGEASSHALIADPVVSIASEGTVFDSKVTVDPPGVVTFDLALRLVEASEPVAKAKIRLPGLSEPETIELPCFAHQSIQAKVVARSGHSLVLGPLPSLREGHSLVLILTTRSL